MLASSLFFYEIDILEFSVQLNCPIRETEKYVMALSNIKLTRGEPPHSVPNTIRSNRSRLCRVGLVIPLCHAHTFPIIALRALQFNNTNRVINSTHNFAHSKPYTISLFKLGYYTFFFLSPCVVGNCLKASPLPIKRFLPSFWAV